MSSICFYDNIFNLLFQVLAIYAFLTIFFFVYVVNVENRQFVNQINFTIDNIISNDIISKILINKLDNKLDNQVLEQLIGQIDLLELKNTNSSLNEKIKENNEKVKTKAFKILGLSLIFLVFIFCIFLIFFRKYTCNFQYGTFLRTILISLVAVFITEFFFLNLIASKFESINVANIKRLIAHKLDDYISRIQT